MKTLLKNIYGSFFFFLLRFVPLQNKVVFSSFSGKRYGDNPKYLSQELFRKDSSTKQVWIYKTKPFDVPDYITQVKWGSILMIYHLATAKVWIDSHTKPLWVKKRKNQFFIETWHGGLGFKKIEGDAEDKFFDYEVKRMKHNSTMINLLISNCDWVSKIYRRAFWYDGEILKSGFPKSDYLINHHEEMGGKVKAFYQLPEDARIAFYAPTMRNNPEKSMFSIDSEIVLKSLQKKFGGTWYLLIRLHPVNESFMDLFTFNEFVLNGILYPDMQELIGGAEVYISDYSGSIFDSALLYHPTFILSLDEDSYEKERGLYMNIRDLPFPVANSNEELSDNILNFNLQKYQKEVAEYFEETGLYEPGTASQVITDRILKELKVVKK